MVFFFVPSWTKLIYRFADILFKVFLTWKQIDKTFTTVIKLMLNSISSASATKSACIINWHTRHLSPIHLKDPPIHSKEYNFGLTRKELISLAFRKETIALGDRYAFLYHLWYHTSLIRVVDMLQLWEPLSELQLDQNVHWFHKFKLSNIAFKKI